MLVTATPLIRSRGIPPPAYLERVKTNPSMTGMRGLGIDWDQLRRIIATTPSNWNAQVYAAPRGGGLRPGTQYRSGMRGLGIDWGWLENLGTSVVSKIQVPGFGTPLVAPGTTVQTTPQGEFLQRQAEGYPVYPASAQLGANLQTDTGTATIIAAGAVVAVVLIMVMSKKGSAPTGGK